jgi:arylsulfatase
MEGTSLLYTFAEATAPERHRTQYFEITGNRAIYHEGWFARTIHKAPWDLKPATTLEDDVWELYDTRTDFSLSKNVAAQHAARLTELKALFMREAEKYHVLPLDDRFLERTQASIVGRPDLLAGRTSLTLAEGMTGMLENVFINVKNRSKTITAEVEVPAGGGHGAILVQGGRFGGWALYVKNGVPGYDYNFLGLSRATVSAPQPLTAGKHTIRLEFAYDGGGPGKGGNATLSVDGRHVAQGRIERTQSGFFSGDETADVGIDLGTPVVEALGARARSRFTGRIPKVTVEVRDAKKQSDAAAAAAQQKAARARE